MRPLRVLVYPHAMEIGGSQLNAIELAAAVRDRGHDVSVLSDDGPLVDRVHELGLTHVSAQPVRGRPSPRRARQVQRLVSEERFDVVHGYEWPPILESFAGTGLVNATACVGTVMSMSVAPFIPDGVPLVVGTRRIGDSCASRSGPVHVIEPPVDTEWNQPGSTGTAPAPGTLGDDLKPATLRIVLVSRIVRELKLEGILTAIRAVGELAALLPVHLTIVGAGPELPLVRAEAALVNDALEEPAVTLTGELKDPRVAYDRADICIGMGGSALRSLAFAKPLVVQGEGGFFDVLAPQTLGQFLEQGFYGTDVLSQDEATQRLVDLLLPLSRDTARRLELGTWGRKVVEERFSLEGAAAIQEAIYLEALERSTPRRTWVLDGLRSFPRLLGYKLERQRERIRGETARDDFNTRPA